MDDLEYQPIRFYSGFLASPILDTAYVSWHKYVSATSLESVRARKDLTHTEKLSIGFDVDYWVATGKVTTSDLRNAELCEPRFYPWIWKMCADATSDETDLDEALRATSAQSDVVRRSLLGKGIDPCLWTPRATRTARHWYRSYSVLNRAICSVRSAEARGISAPCAEVRSGRLSIFPGRGLSLLRYDGEDDLLLSLETVECLKDAAFSRFLSFVTLDVFATGLSEATLTRVISWQEECLERYSNEGYTLVKAVESIGRAAASELTCPVFFGEHGSYERLLHKLREKEKTLGGVTECTDLLEEIFDEDARTVPACLEIFGTQKLSGHPTISAGRGGSSAANLGMQPASTSIAHAKRLGYAFSRMFLRGYIRRHGAWPPLVVDADNTSRLATLYRQRVVAQKDSSYPLADWEGITFGKIFDFDERDDAWLDSIDDKASALPRDLKQASWMADTYAERHFGRPIPSRRLLINILSDPDFKPSEIIKAIRSGELPAEWLSIALYPKEREFKLEARMFAIVHYKLRYALIAMESNLAKNVFPYLDCQTMTLAMNETLSILHRLSAGHEREDKLALEIDLSRWSLRWRELPVGEVGMRCNQLFGETRIFTSLHGIFERCLIYLRVRNEEPAGMDKDPRAREFSHQPTKVAPELIPASTHVWGDGVSDGRKHLGGFEGLGQKLWSLCTYAMIEIALQDFECSFMLVGQGDNQVVSLSVPLAGLDPTEYRDRKREFCRGVTEAISRSAADVNQEVKPEECVESTTVVSYGKIFFVRGAEAPQYIKLHSRIQAKSSSDFPSVAHNFCGAIVSAHGASALGCSPLRSYQIGVLVACMYLAKVFSDPDSTEKNFSYAARTGSRALVYDTALNWPSDLGGWPVMSPIAFMYKGGGDPLGKALCWLLMSKDASYASNRALCAALGDDMWKGAKAIRPEILVKDPYSLPVLAAADSAGVTTRAALDSVRAITRNPDLKALFDAGSPENSGEAYSLALKVRPFNPVIAREIFDLTPTAEAEKFERMFVTTRTIQTGARRDVSLAHRVLTADGRFSGRILACLNLRCSSRYTGPASSYELAKLLRKKWEPIIGCAVEGVGCLQPFDFRISRHAPSRERPGIMVHLAPGLERERSRGMVKPYLGRDTSPHLGYTVKLHGASGPTHALRRLLTLSTYLDGSPTTQRSLASVARARAPVPFSGIEFMAPELRGGALDHRFAGQMSNRGSSITGTSAFATWCRLDSDTSGELSGGERDYPIMFQEFFCALIAVARIENLRGSDQGAFVMFEIGRPGSLEELLPLSYGLNACLSPPSQAWKKSRLLYEPHLGIESVARASMRGSRFGTTVNRMSQIFLVRAIASDWLRSSGALALLADGAHADLVPPLDLAECAALGLDTLLEGLALSLAAATNFASSRRIQRSRWERFDHDLTARRLAPGFAAVCRQFVDHPAYASSPLHRELRGNTSLRYTCTTSERICSELLTRAHQILWDPWHYLEHWQEWSGSDTTDQVLSRRRLESMFLAGTAATSDGSNPDVVGKILSACQKWFTDRHSSDAVSLSISLASLTNTETAGLLCPAMIMVGPGAATLSTGTLRSEMRWLRRARPWNPPPPMKTLGLHRTVGGLHVTCNTQVVIPSRYREIHSTSRRENLRARALYRVTIPSDHAELWSVFAGCAEGRTALVIGSGEGHTARAVLLAGAKFCHGLDRGTDILRGSSSSPSCHIPKALVGLDIADRYLQHEINWKCPGGIEDPSVQLALDSTFTGDHIVCFLDFLSASAMPLRDCEWICSRPWVDWSVLRVFGTAEEVSGLVRDIVHAAQIVKCARLTDRSWLILSSRWTQRAHMCASNNRLTLSAIPALFSTLALGASATAREELFGSLTLRIPAPGRLDTVREALTASRTLGDVRRVRYDEWTVVLGAIVGAMLLEASPEELRGMYDEVSSDGFLLVPRLGAVQYSKNLDHVLTRIVPPGLSPEQIRALAADLDTEPAPSEY